MNVNTSQNVYDCIIIGGGILGSFHAYYAAKMELNVLILEKDVKPNKATVQNFGMVATGSIATSGSWKKFANNSNDIYRMLQKEIPGGITLRKEGSYLVAIEEQECDILGEISRLVSGISLMDRDEISETIPSIKASYAKSGLYFPADMSLDPKEFIHIFHKHISRKKNLKILYDSPVISVKKKGESLHVTTQAGNTYEVNHFLICSGTDFQMLFHQHFLQSGLKICKLQMLRSEPVSRIPANILSDLSIRRYPLFKKAQSLQKLLQSVRGDIYQKYGIHLLIKQTDNGSLIIGDLHQYYSLDSSINYENSSEINSLILSYLQKMFSFENLKISHTWNGYYMVNPGKEIYNEEIFERVHVITGIGGKGISTGPGFSKHNIQQIIS